MGETKWRECEGMHNDGRVSSVRAFLPPDEGRGIPVHQIPDWLRSTLPVQRVQAVGRKKADKLSDAIFSRSIHLPNQSYYKWARGATLYLVRDQKITGKEFWSIKGSLLLLMLVAFLDSFLVSLSWHFGMGSFGWVSNQILETHKVLR